MPAVTTISILDGQATPATHVYTMAAIKADGLSLFTERTSGAKIGEPSLSLHVRNPNKDSNAYKVTVQMNKPKVVSVTDLQGRTRDVIDYQSIAKVEFTFPPQMTKAERNDVLMLLANGLDNATVKTVVSDLEGFW